MRERVKYVCAHVCTHERICKTEHTCKCTSVTCLFERHLCVFCALKSVPGWPMEKLCCSSGVLFLDDTFTYWGGHP